jgi:hypothetical protein
MPKGWVGAETTNGDQREGGSWQRGARQAKTNLDLREPAYL